MHDGVGLPGARLAVGHHAAVEAQQHVLEDVHARLPEDDLLVVLRLVRLEDVLEGELPFFEVPFDLG